MKIMSEWTKIIITNLLLIMVQYALSIGMVFYQRWFLKQYAFPLFLTAYDQLVRFAFLVIFRLTFFCTTGKERVSLSWKNNIQTMAILGAATATHLFLSNFSLELNTISFHTVSRSTSIIFILILVLTFRLEKFSWKMIFIVSMIAGGVLMFTFKSTYMTTIGLIVALLATFMSALRWTLAQYVFQKSKLGIENPLDLMYYVDLWVFILLIPVAIVFEGSKVMRSYELVGDRIIGLATISAAVAFLMEVTKYLILQRTSSITLSVLGIIKDVATIAIAFITLDDRMTIINFFGLIVCVTGVASHVVYKYRRAKEQHYKDIELAEKTADKTTIESENNNMIIEDSSYVNVVCHAPTQTSNCKNFLYPCYGCRIRFYCEKLFEYFSQGKPT